MLPGGTSSYVRRRRGSFRGRVICDVRLRVFLNPIGTQMLKFSFTRRRSVSDIYLWVNICQFWAGELPVPKCYVFGYLTSYYSKRLQETCWRALLPWGNKASLAHLTLNQSANTRRVNTQIPFLSNRHPEGSLVAFKPTCSPGGKTFNIFKLFFFSFNEVKGNEPLS